MQISASAEGQPDSGRCSLCGVKPRSWSPEGVGGRRLAVGEPIDRSPSHEGSTIRCRDSVAAHDADARVHRPAVPRHRRSCRRSSSCSPGYPGRSACRWAACVESWTRTRVVVASVHRRIRGLRPVAVGRGHCEQPAALPKRHRRPRGVPRAPVNPCPGSLPSTREAPAVLPRSGGLKAAPPRAW